MLENKTKRFISATVLLFAQCRRRWEFVWLLLLFVGLIEYNFHCFRKAIHEVFEVGVSSPRCGRLSRRSLNYSKLNGSVVWRPGSVQAAAHQPAGPVYSKRASNNKKTLLSSLLPVEFLPGVWTGGHSCPSPSERTSWTVWPVCCFTSVWVWIMFFLLLIPAIKKFLFLLNHA